MITGIFGQYKRNYIKRGGAINVKGIGNARPTSYDYRHKTD